MSVGKARFKVLVVDDEEDNRVVCRDLLQGEGLSVITAGSVEDALEAARRSEPDLILSDVSMPDADGLTLLKRLKGDPRLAKTPVILMSGLHKAEKAQVDGLEKGADDYLAKPFSPSLLAAKVRAVLRRRGEQDGPSGRMKHGGLELNLEARTALLKGRKLELTRKEFDLLTTFLRKPGQVLSASYLLETVWGYEGGDYDDPHTVGVHVSSLRKKLGERIGRRFVGVRGLGYRFDR